MDPKRVSEISLQPSSFSHGPKSVLLYGAASFLYELYPSNGGQPDLATISTFFGAKSDGNDGWTFNNAEQIPSNWSNRPTPYGLADVATEVAAQYLLHPVLFGGNAGVGNFDLLDSFGAIQDGRFDGSTQDALCLLYLLATENVPSSLSGVVTLPLTLVEWVLGKLNPIFAGTGCPLKTL